jgi:hypothetical protein
MSRINSEKLLPENNSAPTFTVCEFEMIFGLSSIKAG